MIDLRLGDILVQHQLVTEAQLEEALNLQRDQPDRLVGHILVELGHLRYGTLVTAVVKYMHLPNAKELIEHRKSCQEPLDEYGVPLPRMSASEMSALALAPDEFPVPIPAPSLEFFTELDETELDTVEDSFGILNEGTDAETTDFIEQSLAVFPKSKALLYFKAWNHSQHHRFEESLDVLLNIHQYKRNPALLSLASYNRQWLGRQHEAVENLQALLRQPNPPCRDYFALGYSLQKLRYWKRARQVYTHYIKCIRGETAQSVYARQQIVEIIRKQGV